MVLNTLSNTFLAISGIGILILAIAASVAIIQSYRIRKEDRVRNIQARAMDEILNWASEAQQIMFSFSIANERDKWEARWRLSLLSMRSPAMASIAGIFGNEMEEKVQGVLNSLDKFEKSLLSADAPEDEGLFDKLRRSLVDLLIGLYHRRIEMLCFTKEYERLLSQTKRFLEVK